MVGVTGAIIGSAVIGAGASLLGSSAQNKAANKAADASNQAAQLQYQLGQQSLGLNQAIYNSNYGLLSPFVSNGLAASNSLNALLGLPAGPSLQSPLASGTALGSGTVPAPTGVQTLPAQVGGGSLGPVAQAGGSFAPDLMQRPGTTANSWGDSRSAWLANANRAAGRAQGTPTAARTAPRNTGGTATPAAGGSPANALSPQRAFENFANSAGMQFQLETGADAINNLYAARGALQSGAAMKAINDYSQKMALHNYFMPYMGMLQGQQGMGVQAGGAIAGVGVNAANTAANINQGMGNAAAGNAANLGNIYLGQGANQANMWNNLGSSFGTALGALGGGFGGGSPINVTSSGGFGGWY